MKELSMSKIKLTIVTVCRNAASVIRRTAESIVSQTWQDFEWVIIDGASTDDTLDCLKPYEARINQLISEPDTGIYNAMNKGIRTAKGEYLLFMNAGDLLHDAHVLENIFAKGKFSEDILYGDVQEEYLGKSQIFHYEINITPRYYFLDHVIHHQASFIKRELFARFGYYDETLRIASDWKQWIIFAMNWCSFRHVGIIVATFYKEGLSCQHMDWARREMISVINSYYHAAEIMQYSGVYEPPATRHHAASFVCGIASGVQPVQIVQSVQAEPPTAREWWRLFGLIPVVKVKRNARKSRYLLFGVIPLVVCKKY